MFGRLVFAAPLVPVLLLAACTGSASPAPPAAAQPAAPASAGAAPAAAAPGAAAPAAPAATSSLARTGDGGVAPAPLNPPVKIRVGDGVVGTHSGLYVAMERGYFQEEGIELETTRAPTFADELGPLAGGTLDAGYVSGADPGLFDALARGVGLRLVGCLSSLQPTGQGSNSVGTVVENPTTVRPNGSCNQFILLSEAFATRQPEAGRRYVTAWLRGQRDYWRAIENGEGDPREILEILTRYTALQDIGLDEAMMKDNGLNHVDPNGGAPLQRLVQDAAPVQEYFVRVGHFPQPVDLGPAIDSSFLDYALQRLGRIPS